jgi:uncharacterized protein YdcH (DUF465 family)
MNNIVKIQITPVKTIHVNPLYEHFDPNDYTESQKEALVNKGYTEDRKVQANAPSNASATASTNGLSDDQNKSMALFFLQDFANQPIPKLSPSDLTKLVNNQMLPMLEQMKTLFSGNPELLSIITNTINELKLNPTLDGFQRAQSIVKDYLSKNQSSINYDMTIAKLRNFANEPTPDGLNLPSAFSFYINEFKDDIKKNSNNLELTNFLNSLLLELNSNRSLDTIKKIKVMIREFLNKIQKPAFNTDIAQNKNFAESKAAPIVSTTAISGKLLEADKKYSDLKAEIKTTNDSVLNNLQREYEGKIKSWTDDYTKSIKYYKEYIKAQEDALVQLQNQNEALVSSMERNDAKLNKLSKSWNEIQGKISNLESGLTQSSNKKYSEIIKNLEQQLIEEKSKQGNIDSKLALLRAEKSRLDKAYEENLEKIKMAGLGNNCPKNFNRNDYILKKNIPCWGCKL